MEPDRRVHGGSETRAVKFAGAARIIWQLVCAERRLVRDIFDQRNSVISPAALIARLLRSTHIFSTTLEIVALMGDRAGLSGACFQKSWLPTCTGCVKMHGQHTADTTDENEISLGPTAFLCSPLLGFETKPKESLKI